MAMVAEMGNLLLSFMSAWMVGTVEAPAIEELEATSGCKVTRPRTRKVGSAAAPLVLPDELFWKCLSFWKSARDPSY